MGRKYRIESSHQTSFPSMTLTLPPFSIVPLLTSLLLPPLLLLVGALGLGSSHHLHSTVQLSLHFHSNKRFSSNNFQKACSGNSAFYLNLKFPSSESYSSLFLSSAAALFTFLKLNAAKSSISFGCIRDQFQV